MGKPTINVYKYDLCGEPYNELGKMTNHVKHKTGHNIEKNTIRWIGDGIVKSAKGFISGKTYVEHVQRHNAGKEATKTEKAAIRDNKLTNKRKRAEPEPVQADEAPNTRPKRQRVPAKAPETAAEPQEQTYIQEAQSRVPRS